MDEIFLEDDETGLLVSNLGRVVGQRGIVLKDCLDHGYKHVGWRNVKRARGVRNKKKFIHVHRLVARNFIPNPNNLPCVNHIDENKLNNRVDNLEWCSYKYNNNYGTCRERSFQTRLSNGGIKPCILQKGDITVSARSLNEMSRLIGVCVGSISPVVSRKITHCSGWHLIGESPAYTTKPKPINLVDPSGRGYSFNSLHEAAKLIGARPVQVSRILNNRATSCKGWHFKGVLPNLKDGRKPVCFINNRNEYLTFNSFSDAARHFNTRPGVLSNVKAGRCKSYKGWKYLGDPRSKKVRSFIRAVERGRTPQESSGTQGG